MKQYEDYQLKRMIERRRNCHHRELQPIYKKKKNWWFGKKSTAREIIMGVRYYECKNCGLQFYDEEHKMPRIIKEKKR